MARARSQPDTPRRFGRILAVAVLLTGLGGAPTGSAAELAPCRLKGLEQEALCGRLLRPLDPERAEGATIELVYALLPALSRHKLPDPVLFVAGGPGQSATGLAAPLAAQFAGLRNRRDLVFVDQRGTGRSAPLNCPDDNGRAVGKPLADQLAIGAQIRSLDRCRAALEQLPYGDLRRFTTAIAAADLEAVRIDLGAERIDLIGASYGTRVVLEYLRRFPQYVRRAVLDGVVPPDMNLPLSFARDAGAALERVFADCERDADCAGRYPDLRDRWRRLMAADAHPVTVAHPVTGIEERIEFTPAILANLVRSALYSPVLASALPAAIAAAGDGRMAPLLALTAGGGELAHGMHFSVICAEDMGRPEPAGSASVNEFERGMLGLYRQVCARWPALKPPAEFYAMPPAGAPTLVLSGGLDPVTGPRHGRRVAQALGDRALYIEAGNLGHGVMMTPCGRELVNAFVTAADDAAAGKIDRGCAAAIPRPRIFIPPGGAR